MPRRVSLCSFVTFSVMTIDRIRIDCPRGACIFFCSFVMFPVMTIDGIRIDCPRGAYNFFYLCNVSCDGNRQDKD